MRCPPFPHRTLFALLALALVAPACGSEEAGTATVDGQSDARVGPDLGRERDTDEADEGGGDDNGDGVPDAESDGDLGSEDDADPGDIGDDGSGAADTSDDSGTGGTPACDPPASGYGPSEVCGDGLDNDHDEDVDEGCPCTLGSTQPCFPGDPAQLGIGQCLPGVQICSGNPAVWGECDGGFTPSDEVCDNKDNDCDGCVDDGLVDCTPSFTCPVEETARPLSTYALNGPAILDITGATGWSWSVVPPRNSGTSGPVNPNAAVTSVFLDVSGDYLVSVSATDEKGALFGCSWIVRAQGDGLRVELNWDTMGDVDLDLHVHRSGTETNFCTADDCYYANCNVSGGDELDWGYPHSPVDVCDGSLSFCPNPRLDLDNIRREATPENINIDNPAPGDTFRIMVHSFSQDVSPTRARLSIYCGGRLRAVLGEPPREAVLSDSGSGCQGDTWRVADVRITTDLVSGAADCRVNPLIDEAGDWDIRNDDATF